MEQGTRGLGRGRWVRAFPFSRKARRIAQERAVVDEAKIPRSDRARAARILVIVFEPEDVGTHAEAVQWSPERSKSTQACSSFIHRSNPG